MFSRTAKRELFVLEMRKRKCFMHTKWDKISRNGRAIHTQRQHHQQYCVVITNYIKKRDGIETTSSKNYFFRTIREKKSWNEIKSIWLLLNRYICISVFDWPMVDYITGSKNYNVRIQMNRLHSGSNQVSFNGTLSTFICIISICCRSFIQKCTKYLQDILLTPNGCTRVDRVCARQKMNLEEKSLWVPNKGSDFSMSVFTTTFSNVSFVAHVGDVQSTLIQTKKKKKLNASNIEQTRIAQNIIWKLFAERVRCRRGIKSHSNEIVFCNALLFSIYVQWSYVWILFVIELHFVRAASFLKFTSFRDIYRVLARAKSSASVWIERFTFCETNYE